MVNTGEPQGSCHSVEIRGETLAWRQGSTSATKEIVYGSYNNPIDHLVLKKFLQINQPCRPLQRPIHIDWTNPILS